MTNYVFNQINLIKTIIENYKIFTLLLAGVSLFLGANITAQAATFTVANTNDGGAGSLRQAILDANINNEDDTINFDPAVFSTPQTIVLTTGQFVIDSDRASGSPKTLTINGPGANLLAISGNNQSRVIFVEINGRLIMKGVKITGGNGNGGRDNFGMGGGILVHGGNLGENVNYLVLMDSIIDGNESQTLGGGGISLSGSAAIINTTISNNKSLSFGGGISLDYRWTLHLINSTVSNNKTGVLGGGISVNAAQLYLTNSTIAYNQVTDQRLEPSRGAGIFLQESGLNDVAKFYSKNSIIANNIDENKLSSDIYGDVISKGFNIIGDTSELLQIEGDTTGNQLNVNPQIDPILQTNDGVIPTHALHANSPAIDKGDNCVLNTTANGGCLDDNLTTDQRGITRPQDGDENGTATVDIGAFEITGTEVSQSPNAPNLQSANDTGVSNSDNITSSRNLTFDVSGTITGINYEFLRNGELIASKTSNSSTITFSDNNLPADGVFVYSVRQKFGNTPSFQSSVVVTIDNTAPTATINQTDAQPDPTSIQPVNYKVVFSETVTGFDAADVSLANSTAGVSMANILLTGSGLAYIAIVSNVTSDGTIIAKIPANAVQDLAGNMSAASTSTNNTVTFDKTSPAVTINQTTAQVEPTRNSWANFTVVFSEPVTGFTNADISLAGSTANVNSASIMVTGSGTTYDVAVSNISSNGGFVQASVKNQAATDLAGNLSVASTSTDNAVTIDNIGSTVTINQAAGQADPTNSLPINFTVVFSEPVTGFDAADISFSGSSTYTADASVEITGSGTTYNVVVGNISFNGGVLRATVRSGGASDTLGNSNFSSTSTDNTVFIDNVAPTVTINQAIGQSDPTRIQPIKFAVVFNEPITGFGADDISLAGSTADVSSANITVTRSGSVYTVSISNITTSGQVRASLAAGAAQDQGGNSSLASTNTDNVITVNIIRSLIDFDGDGKSDVSVFRPSTGGWYLLRSSDSSFFGQSFGVDGDVIAPADYDGDGKTDFAVFRPDSGSWYLQQSTNGFTGIQFGQNGDIPVPADYDGDGKADIAVFRPLTGGWYRLNSSNGQFVAVAFGTTEDKPTIGDFDGDGKADIAVFRPSTANWFRLNSSNNQFVAVPFGAAEDKLTPADFDGDGKTDIAVFRPSTGGWYRLNSTNGEFVAVGFGTAEDQPVAADYDGDGKADIAVFRPSDGTWYLLRSTTGFTAVQFGQSNDKPVPNAFVR